MWWGIITCTFLAWAKGWSSPIAPPVETYSRVARYGPAEPCVAVRPGAITLRISCRPHSVRGARQQVAGEHLAQNNGGGRVIGQSKPDDPR